LSTNEYVAIFASANVGNNIAVSVSGLALTGSASGNYVLSPSGVVANVTPVTLMVSAVNNSRTYGLQNPPLTVTYSGFVHGEGTNVLTGAPGLITSATTSSPPGVYPITVSVGTLYATNYSFNFVNGTLTVVAQPRLSTVALGGNQLVFSWPTITNQTYIIEATTNLSNPVWTPVGGAVTGTGIPVSVTNTIGASPQEFFRLSITANWTIAMVVQPKLSTVALSGNRLAFTWPTIANETYTIEDTTNLNSPVWTPVGGAVMGTGNPVSVTNTPGAFPQLYFRLSINP
jgi:hypothetical protein